MDISICMIVKDEERFLEDSLNSIKGFGSELIIVDTGSSDSTKSIAEKYTDKVYDFKWVDDFSVARNFSVSFASNDWIMFLDADECLINYKSGSIQKLFENPESLGSVERENDSGADAVVRIVTSWVPRIFNRSFYEFKGAIHEQLVRKDGQPSRFFNVKLLLKHYGYSLDVVKAKEKNIRNRVLLEKELEKYGDDPYLYYKLGQTYISSEDKDYEKANEHFERAVGLETQTVYEYFFDLIHLYGYSLINAGQYSKALDIVKYKDNYNNRPDFIFLLAHIYMNNAMFDKAIDMFKRCTSMKGERAKGVTSYLAYYNIGVIYECLGNTPLAAKNYKACGDYLPAKSRLKEITR